MKTELEFKWGAGTYEDFSRFVKTSRRFGASAGPEEKLRNRDYYLDTPSATLRAAGKAARIRDTGSRWEFTLKSDTEFRDGMARRNEQTFPLETDGTASFALKHLKSGLLRAQGLELPFEYLGEIFTIDTRRRQRLIEMPGGTRALATFDDSKINAGDLEGFLREIEFELVEGNEQGFKNFAKKVSVTAELKPCKLSKVAAAYSLLDGTVSF